MKKDEKSLIYIRNCPSIIAATIMFEESLFGERTTGITTIIGIFGICLIAKSSVRKVKKS